MEKHVFLSTMPCMQVAHGTQAFNAGPAMTAEQCEAALAAGAEAVRMACQQMAAAADNPPDWQDSHGVVCIGELGIGNTTAAAALVAALCPDLSPADVCGRGTGEHLVAHKLAAV